MSGYGLRAIVAVVLVLLTGRPVHALFHIAVIDEVMTGCGADPTVQYVEIRMLQSGQTVVADTRLATFSCDGSVIDRLVLVPQTVDLSNGMSGARWIIGSASFQSATGIIPDVVMTDIDPGIFRECGMVCWGAPGTTPPDPATWDPTNPSNYVDCVAWGPYTGPLPPGFGSILTSTPGNGTQSLTRTGPNAYDNGFGLAAPSPTNNDGAVGTIAGCSGGAATTTTTPPGGGSTTSTTTSGGGTTSTTTGPALRGGGSAKTDCFGEWRVAGATGTTPVVTCTDNDPTCDTSPAAGCVIRTQLCFNDAAASVYAGKCTASPVTGFALSKLPAPDVSGPILAGLTGLPGSTGSSFSPPLSALTCTGPIDLPVPLKVKGTKTKKGSLTLKSVTTADKKDKDKLKLVCIP
jgi:hypothetical protein